MNTVLAPWRNLRYTYLTSSLLLALPFSIGFMVQGLQAGRRFDEVLVYWAMVVLHLALFPLAREFYFTATAPVRRGLEGFVLWGPLALAVVVGKVIVYLILNILSIPLGLVGFILSLLRARFT